MNECSAGIVPIQKGDKFSKIQCPRNELERKEMERIPYASVVGSLNYVQTCTRPDISFLCVGMLGRYQSNPGWTTGKSRRRKSTFGYLFLLAEGAISWKSGKQSVIATSTMEAEFVACFEATIHALWLRNFISGLGIVDSIAKPLRIYCDNSAAVFFSKNDKYSKGAKHMELKFLSVKEETALPNNNSVRGYEVIDVLKIAVELVCPGVVSCADILAIAARDSVVVLGGPTWSVLLGRRDSIAANVSAASTNLPGPALSLAELILSFSNQGLSVTDLVALSGAHTIGQAHCVTFRDRIYNDTDIDASFAQEAQESCPSSRGSGDSNLTPLDVQTPTLFDKDYFNNLINMKGLLHSDQQLYSGGSTDELVSTYNSNATQFRIDFATAMIRMGNIQPLTGSDGEIRTNCRTTN
ncbi:peroxidase P7-like [Silene latifolia]|uniref:peroxidase P7-like n=1 Tax=Silene latifolia TaxID=37657 RepID=UPI003D784AEE